MKELSIEEKARRYDEAIERARLINNKGTWVRGGSTGPSICEQIFPELSESEDERIRKAMIDYFKWNPDGQLLNEFSNREVFAWLKKQGEYDNFRNKIQIGDKVTRNEDGVLVNLSQLKRLAKQGEQKPKYRVGDTIKCKYDDRQFTIKSVDLDKGTYTYTQEGCGNDIDYADEEFELVQQKPNKIFDSSKLKPDPNPYWTRSPEYQLATGQKPADKIEPKFKIGDTITDPTDSTFTFHINAIKDGKYMESDKDWVLIKEADSDYELVEQKPAWSEEGEMMLECTIDKISDLGTGEMCKEWLNSLRHQTTWKPSDEQMEALERMVNFAHFDEVKNRDIVRILLNELKKLKEE